MANEIEPLVSKFVSDLTNLIRRQVVTDLQRMSIKDLMQLSSGGGGGSAAVVIGAPKRGPGRPKKTAAVAYAPRAPKAGGRKRRSRETAEASAAKLLDRIVPNLGKEGARAEDLRALLGVDKPAITEAITYGLENGVLKKTGEKRGTKYFAK